MRFQEAVSTEWIATFLNAEIVGDKNILATGLNEIHTVEQGDICFVDSDKYYAKVLGSIGTVILIDKKMDCPEGKVLVVTPDPCGAFIKLCLHFRPFVASASMISPTAVIGEGTVLQPNVFVGNNVIIGKNCRIHPFVCIYDNSVIGDNVIINSNTVIGGDAFYFKTRPNNELRYDKMHPCGRAVIESDVEIGNGCCIDRGVSGDTTIGRGSKLDNLIHIGHDSKIGKNCLFAAQVGIAGAVFIGDNVTIYGQTGVAKDLTIGPNTLILAKSGIPKSIPGGKVWFGIPAMEAKDKMEELVWIKRLPQLFSKDFKKNDD